MVRCGGGLDSRELQHVREHARGEAFTATDLRRSDAAFGIASRLLTILFKFSGTAVTGTGKSNLKSRRRLLSQTSESRNVTPTQRIPQASPLGPEW